MFKDIRHYYPWLVVATGTLVIFSALGLGRFALGMILPSMSHALDLSPAEMGFISTSNFTGYLTGVLVCMVLGRSYDARYLITLALFLSGVSMCAMSGASSARSCAFLYFVTGTGSGLSNIPTMALVSTWFKKDLRGRAAGFMVSGSGFAIMLSGVLVPYLNRTYPGDGWRVAWLLLGIITLLVGLICYVVIRNSPEEIGLLPYESGLDESSEAGTPPVSPSSKGLRGGISLGKICHLSAIYFCFGASYTIYVTFFVVSLTGERGFSEAFAGGLWGLIGFLSLFSGPVPGVIADRAGRSVALMVVFSMHALSFGLAAMPGGIELLAWASVVAFGLSAWGIPGIMTAIVADVAGPVYTARVFAIVTVVLGVGQIIGPLSAGAITEATSSLRAAFWLVSSLALMGGIFSFLLKKTSLL